MKLKRLSIVNFRSFFAMHDVEFSTDEDRKLTIFVGSNGNGKTNLINAIYWCLTGELTESLKRKSLSSQRIVHIDAIKDDPYAEASCELSFEHEGVSYRAVRKYSKKGESFDVFQIEKDGRTSPRPNQQNFIQTFIPKSLSNWFFYDAEALTSQGHLQLSGSEKFKAALRKTLGFELLEKTILDLESCTFKTKKKSQSLVKNKDIEDLVTRIENINLVLPKNRAKLLEQKNIFEAKKNELDVINKSLEALPKSTPLQIRRKDVTSKYEQSKNLKKKIQSDIAILEGQSYPSIFLYDLAIAFEKNLKKKGEEGKIPSPYSETLLNNIITANKCICNRDVKKGSPEETALKALLENATTNTLNERLKKCEFAVTEIRGFFDSFEDKYAALHLSLNETEESISFYEEELEEISNLLKEIDDEKIQSLELKRKQLVDEHAQAYSDYQFTLRLVSENDNNLSDLSKKHTEALKKAGMSETVEAELKKIEKMKSFLIGILKDHESRAIKIIEAELNKRLALYLTKHYTVTMNSDTYSIIMKDDQGRTIDESTGEGEVLKYVFISTVLALAGLKTEEKIKFISKPTLAPLVMDAPFTSLGDEYMLSTAKNVIEASSQLILMMLPKVLEDKILSDVFLKNLGKCYAIVSESSGPKGNKPTIVRKVFNKETVIFNEFDAFCDGSKFKEIHING